MNSTGIVLETKRLILRRFNINDVKDLARISADEKVMRFFPSIQSRDETTGLVERIISHHIEYGYSLYAVENREAQKFIGFIGLIQPSFHIPNFIPNSLPIVEIGWRLDDNYWGQGLATEGASAVLSYAFNKLGLKEIISFTAKINKPSIRVMEKIGLSHDGKDDFIHPKLDKNDRLAPHVLMRKSIGHV